MNKLKVLVVDDSKLIREVLTSILSADVRLEVVGSAEDPYQARELIKQLAPDVLTLDVEMPRMSGIDFLKNLMRLRPMPVVMISTLTAAGSSTTLEALEIGAIDFLEKPANITQIMDDYRETVIEKVIAAANAPKTALLRSQNRLQQAFRNKQQNAPESSTQVTPANPAAPKCPNKIVAIGGSTGGLEALRTLLESTQFNGNETIVVTLHLPGAFTQSFATRLDGVLPYKVVEAKADERLQPGTVYIAPGDYHLAVKKRAVGYQAVVSDTERVNHHKPSVEVLFDSVAAEAKDQALGIIMTGMGKDGAKGLLNMKNAGAKTYAQDEASSVVWGMPGAAAAINAAHFILPLPKIGVAMTQFFMAKA